MQDTQVHPTQTQHQLPPLPYPLDALQPHISKETIELHYGKHHQAYVTNLNKLVKDTEFENSALEAIIKKSSGSIFDNAAQVWNHTFYWQCLSPKGGGQPKGPLGEAIIRKFGSFDAFLWKFVSGKPDADALSKELKRRGFRFVGTTICHAFMQAVGIVNDHTTDCFRRRKV